MGTMVEDIFQAKMYYIDDLRENTNEMGGGAQITL